MATEYKLSYTAAEIDEKLGKVDENTANISQLSKEIAEKVSLPKDLDGKLIVPLEGQTLLFRADGTTYYGTPTATGGGNTDDGDNGSNDGTGGDSSGEVEYEEIPVTLTWDNGSLNGETGVFTASAASPTYGSHSELIDGTAHNIKIRFPYSPDQCNASETGGAAFQIFVYSSANENSYIGRYLLSTGEIGTSASWENGAWDTDVIIPCGYFVRIYMKKGASSTAVGGGFQSNSLFGQYIKNNMVQVYQVAPVAEEVSVAQLIDDDYAMNYGVSTLSLITDVEDTTTFKGVLETAKNEWMVAYGGDINKIPLIVHTDQHGYLDRSKEIGDVFDTISSMVNWYDLSKVINLGDTANAYSNYDNLTAGSTTLEKYLDAMKEVPFSKRIEIFGNHDAMYMDGATLTSIYHDQSYLNPYFRNINARKTSNNGYFVVKDDNFNVKYVVLSGFEFDEDYPNKYVMSSEQHEWMIEELEKADGYDVIILSHVPLTGTAGTVDLSPIASARKTKTSGTITDKYGVEHTFDFSGCDGELLCSLHGHVHEDGSGYYGTMPYATFENFYASPRCLYFVLVDRANEQLNIWKVDSTPQYQNFQIPFTQVIQ